MICSTVEERDALRHGDAGRCAATLEIPSIVGPPAVVRCQRTAWHKRRGHRFRLAPQQTIRWPGEGSSRHLGWPTLPSRDFDKAPS